MDSGLAHIYDLREGRRHSWPIRPYEGIYGIESQEDLDEAMHYMGCTDDAVVEPDKQSGGGHWLIHYDYGKRTDKVIGYSSLGVHIGMNMYSSFRRHKNHLTVGYSPVHSYRCTSLEWARENYRKQVKRLEQTMKRRAKLLAEIPKTIKVTRNLYKSGMRTRAVRNSRGYMELRPYFEERIPTDEIEIVEQELVGAYEVWRSGWQRDWRGVKSKNKRMVFVVLDEDGKKVRYMRRESEDLLIEVGLKEPKTFVRSSEQPPKGDECVGDAVPGEEFEVWGWNAANTFRRLKAVEMRKQMDKGVLKGKLR